MPDLHEVIQAKTDPAAREVLIARQSAYICRCASKASGRWVDTHDDLYSIALIAFNDALNAYTPIKGSFSLFSSRVIQNRIIDHLRQERRHARTYPFSALTNLDTQGNIIAFDAEDVNSSPSDTSLEISSLSQELETFGISFFDLPAASPKAAKTKKACHIVIQYILSNPELLKSILRKKSLPDKQILECVPVSKKTLERHRKYIIAGVLITSGGYTIMSQYFGSRKEEKQL